MSHFLLWGNTYTQIIGNVTGKVLALYPLIPDKMAVEQQSWHFSQGLYGVSMIRVT